MLINAKQDTVSTTIYTVGNSGEPGIDTRKIQTELLVDDGNVIVIGGVIDNESTANKQTTPGLSDIPILGRLFKNRTRPMTPKRAADLHKPQNSGGFKALDKT